MALKTLDDPSAKEEVLSRLSRLTSESQRRWGKMTAGQAVCHLSDSFKGVIGEKGLGRIDNFISRSFVKWVALKGRVRWPHGAKTMPEMDQHIGGTPPVEFEKDVAELRGLVERVTSPSRDFKWQYHPFFGHMSEWEWQRWAYLHMDHHLRQFGA